MPYNDNDSAASGGTPPDAHGEAALLLVESLIHGLVSRSIISNADAVDIADGALSVQVDLAEAADEGAVAAARWRAHELLAAITQSLLIDGGEGAAPS